MKLCPRCQAVRPRAAFNRCRGNADGLQAWCADCMSDVNGQRRRGVARPPKRRRCKVCQRKFTPRHRERVCRNADCREIAAFRRDWTRNQGEDERPVPQRWRCVACQQITATNPCTWCGANLTPPEAVA